MATDAHQTQALPDGRPLPLLTGPERPMLESWLAFHRATLELKCRGLDDSRGQERCAGRLLNDTGRIADGPMAGLEVSLRWILIHMIEEYARHHGHADIVRERIDGVIGA